MQNKNEQLNIKLRNYVLRINESVERVIESSMSDSTDVLRWLWLTSPQILIQNINDKLYI